MARASCIKRQANWTEAGILDERTGYRLSAKSPFCPDRKRRSTLSMSAGDTVI
jgi:hypothetical protein